MHEERRRELHAKLDELIDRRIQIQPAAGVLNALAPSWPSSRITDTEAAGAVWRAGIAFIAEVLGEPVRAAGPQRLYTHKSEQRAVLKSWMTDLYPLLFAHSQGVLATAPQQEMTIFEVIDALSALDAGEIRPLFTANTGKNRRANRWSLARTKLDALIWKKRLKALGHPEKAANFEVTMAFGEQWDTIRRWKRQCEQILGPGHVAASLAYAGSTHDIHLKPRTGLFGAANSLLPSPAHALKMAGAAYRTELKRSAELAKRKPAVA